MCNIYTASAMIKRLVLNGHLRHQIARMLNIVDFDEIERGVRPFTKWEYLQLCNAYPECEHSIEYYENVSRLSDEDYEDYRFEQERIV